MFVSSRLRVIPRRFPCARVCLFVVAAVLAALLPRTARAQEVQVTPFTFADHNDSPARAFHPCLAGPADTDHSSSTAGTAPPLCVALAEPEADAGSTVNPVIVPAAQTRRPAEGFHWLPALKQSAEFLVIEHGFRVATDPYGRYLLFHKPFWHDYFASLEGHDMARWGDGDDFLVNYIGHPLQGAVTGYIQIQNDPRGRAAKFGKNRAYWMSRLRAMGWSAVYSAEFEFGPVLSETAIGSVGGYTYIPGCGFYPTCDKVPGVHYKPPTNNTGWVDSVVTPAIGTGWILLEDFLDVKLVDRVAKGSHATKFKVLRGVVSPARSLSNALAGKLPWYRFPTTDSDRPAMLAEALLPTASRPSWQDGPRRSLGLHFTDLDLVVDRKGCTGCRTFAPGVGVDFDYRLSRSFYFDSEFNLFPTQSVQEALFGLRMGRRFGSWGLFSQLRPGLIHYGSARVPGTDRYESTNRFALDVGGGAEYYASERSLLRFRMGTTLVRYRQDYTDPRQPPVGVLSPAYITTQGSFYVTSGYLIRF